MMRFPHFILSTSAACFLIFSAGCASEEKETENTSFADEASTLQVATATPVEKVRFNEHVRPILSEQCFQCHGPDADNQESPFRLDSEEASRINLAGEGEAPRYGVVPGKPEESEIMVRILHKEPLERMPPPSAKKTAITAEEVAILREWILNGARYEKHWAYVPPEKPEPPAVKQSKKVGNDIDRFVLAKLEGHDLPVNGEAEPLTLLRRLHLTLTGLPPSPETVQAFLSDPASNRYEKVVDRLLQEPAFAERLAVDWMDVARYADSYGYQVDRDRQVWPWRDWVLDAFRANMPYDQFILHQLAGDLIENPTQESRVATAFNRLHMQKVEGGSVPEEFRVEYVADRAQTASTAFLGITMECARCHDHKFDPITQQDYFQTFALFNSIDENGLYAFFTRAVPSPTIPVLSDQEKKQAAAKEKEAAQALTALEQRKEAARKSFGDWRTSWDQKVVPGDPVASFNFDEPEGDTLLNAVANQPAGKLDLRYSKRVEGFSGKGVQMDGDSALTFGENGPYQRHHPFTATLRLNLPATYKLAYAFGRTKGAQDAGSRGYELLIDQGRLNFALVHFAPGNEVRIRSLQPVPLNSWQQITMTYDGSAKADGLRLYLNGEALETEVLKDHLTKEIYYKKPGKLDKSGKPVKGNPPIEVGARLRDAGLPGAIVDDLRIFDTALSALQVRALDTANPKAKNEEEVFDYFLNRHAADVQAARDELAVKRLALNEYMDSRLHLMVMKELPERRPTYVLKRGLYSTPDKNRKVEPGPPTWLLPFDENYSRDRLGFARWLTHPDHPLTARVTVNRFWQLVFGRGIVNTANDFGLQGMFPTHPDLLDYLARTFVESGWDVRALFKTLVMSKTFRRDSNATPDHLEKDPHNELLARGPANAMTAEMLRDSALQAAGLLSPAVGGSSVNPNQPHQSKYRRSLYTQWIRNSPNPEMLLFGAPRRQICTVQREKTLTPLQPLVLMNSPQFVEASRALAARTLKEAASDADRIEKIFLRVTSRPPKPVEAQALAELLSEQRTYFTDEPKVAQRLIAVGKVPMEVQTSDTCSHEEIAAWTMVANTVMNMDAFYMIR